MAATVNIQVQVEDDKIVITKLGTAFLRGYTKSAEEPRLVLTRHPPRR